MDNGIALRRNGTCLSYERSCGPTAAPFYACCPDGYICSNPYNQVCCDSKTNCTASAVSQPSCADRSWTLYNNGGVDSAYFCCLNGSIGYSATSSNSNGCGSPAYVLRNGEIRLNPLVQANPSSTSTSSTAAVSSTAPPTPTAILGSQSRSGPPVGAIVGTILGAVFLIVMAIMGLWIWKRRRAGNTGPQRKTVLSAFVSGYSKNTFHTEKSHEFGTRLIKELQGDPVNELPSDTAITAHVTSTKSRRRELVELP